MTRKLKKRSLSRLIRWRIGLSEEISVVGLSTRQLRSGLVTLEGWIAFPLNLLDLSSLWNPQVPCHYAWRWKPTACQKSCQPQCLLSELTLRDSHVYQWLQRQLVRRFASTGVPMRAGQWFQRF